MSLIELEEFQGPQFLGFVRNIPTPAPFIAERWLPNKTVLDLSVEYAVGVQDKPVMASIIAWDSEAPIGGRPGPGYRIQHELPPIKRKMKIPEKELIRFLTPRANTSDKQEVIDWVYRDTARLVDGVQARVEWMRMQALSEDTLAYAEENITVELDYGIGADQQYSMDGSGLSTWWSDVANADWVADLQYICDTEETRCGFRPGTFIVPKATTRYMMQNAAAKGYLFGATPPNRQLTWPEVLSLLSIYDLPTVVTYDVQVYREEAAGTISTLRPLDLKKGVLLPSDPAVTLGNTLWGPTAESRPLIGTNRTSQAPGIFVVAYGDFDPPAEWIKVAAVSIPSIPGANLIGQLQLLNPA